MPTPHGTRGGIAFSADEVRVLRHALAEVLSPIRGTPTGEWCVLPAERLRLADGLEAAVEEAGRLRAFLVEELGRTALPRRRDILVDNDVRQRLEAHMPAPRRLPTLPERAERAQHSEGPVLTDEQGQGQGQWQGQGQGHEQKPKPGPRPKPKPAAPKPQQTPQQKPPQEPAAPDAPKREPKPEPKAPEPGKEPAKEPERPARRRTPTPAEIWPPRRRDHKPDQARSAPPARGWLP